MWDWVGLERECIEGKNGGRKGEIEEEIGGEWGILLVGNGATSGGGKGVTNNRFAANGVS